MKVQQTELPEVLIVEPVVFRDSRGFFSETYQKDRYAEAGIDVPFVQDNYSRSARGTLRGMHFQVQRPQGKLIQVLRGAAFDVAVDVRRDSPRFGRWVGVRLSEDDFRQLYVPPGFAHGFYALSETADVWYKCTDTYQPAYERTLLWNDPQVGIEWPLEGPPTLSEKDRRGQKLDELECFSTSPR